MARMDTPQRKPKDTKGTFIRLMSYIGAYKMVLCGVIALCFVSNILSLLGPNFAGKAINEAAAGAGKVNFSMVYYYAKRMLFCYLASSIISISTSMLMMHVSKWIARKMRKDVFEKLMLLPVGYFDQNQAGDIISRVSYDIEVVSSCLATDIVHILNSLVTVVGSLIMMITISPILAIVMIFTIPAAIIYTTKMRKITRPKFSLRSKNYGIMNGFVEEMFSGQKTIMAYAYENRVQENFDKVNGDAANAYYEADYYGMTMGPTVGLINNLGMSLIAVFGSVLYMLEMVTLGQISSFVLYSRK